MKKPTEKDVKDFLQASALAEEISPADILTVGDNTEDYVNDKLDFLCPVCMNNIQIRIIRPRREYGHKNTAYELQEEDGAYRIGALAHLALHGMKLPEDKNNA